jgi:hypothetical protein
MMAEIDTFPIGQRHRVASKLKARPVKGAPNVVGTPVIVGTPVVWVVAHWGAFCDIEGGEDGLESVVVSRGVSEVIPVVDGFGLRATDGGLRPPPPNSVDPKGIPTMPTDEPGPIDDATGGDAVADAVHAPDVLPAIPPPSNNVVPDNPSIEPPVPADAPAVELPMPADAPVIGLPIPADAAIVKLAGADDAPAHITPIMGDAPDVVGLTPGVASSVAPMGIPVCPTGALGMPNGDVMPNAGRGETLMRACA